MNGRELALFEVAAGDGVRSRVIEISSVFGGRVLTAGAELMVMEVSGLPDEIDAVRDLLGDFGLVQTVRSGPVHLTPRSADRPAELGTT